MDIKCGIYLCVQICVFVHLASITDGQSVSLPAPECYNTTTCPCCKPETCPSDGSGLCGGNCLDGYHGGKCWNECPDNCVKCVDAPQGGGVATCSQCRNGYYSTPTQYQCQLSCSSNCKTCESSSSRCTSCETGYYVTLSFKCAACHESCTQCLSLDNCIACKYGYYIKDDTCHRCDPNCEACLSIGTCSCHNGCHLDICEELVGMCIFGCKDNFTSSDDVRCDECMIGLYGYDCSRACPKNCLSTCNRLTGVCTSCKPVTFGDYCEHECPAFCLSNCNKTSGQCDSCLDGYYGNNCTMKCVPNCKTCNEQDGQCSLCVDGFYGGDCNRNCSEHCIIRKCDRLDGRCECLPGYEGDQCRDKVTTTTATSSTEILVVYPEDTNVVAIVGITVGVVAVLVVAVVAVVLSCRRSRRRPVSMGAARVDMAKLRVEIATIEAALVSKEQSSADSRNDDTEDLKIRLEKLQRKLPYSHSEKADRLTTENAYEPLQKRKYDETPYASMKATLVAEEDKSGESRNDGTGELQSGKTDRMATGNTYEQLQRKKTDETPYASMKATLVAEEEKSGETRNDGTGELQSGKIDRMAAGNTYEQLQRQKTDETPYASLKP